MGDELLQGGALTLCLSRDEGRLLERLLRAELVRLAQVKRNNLHRPSSGLPVYRAIAHTNADLDQKDAEALLERLLR